jgi:hypothetical protein
MSSRQAKYLLAIKNQSGIGRGIPDLEHSKAAVLTPALEFWWCLARCSRVDDRDYASIQTPYIEDPS